MPREKNPATALAEKMVQALEARRHLENAAPMTLGQLAVLADPSAPTEQIEKAAARRTFTDRVIVVQKKNLDAPVALPDEIESFARSPVLLEFVLETLCTPTSPTCPISRLKTKVPPRLKKPFEEAVKRHIGANSLPSSVGTIQVRKTAHLYLLRMPPPPPPAVALAQKLIRVLEAQRRLGESSYPLSLERLIQLTDEAAPEAVVKKAIAVGTFRSHVLLAMPRKRDAPVALAGDVETLAGSRLLLEYVLSIARTPATHAFSVNDFKRKMNAILWPAFQEVVNRQIVEESLPPTVGWIVIRGKKYLFLLKDLHASERDKRAAAPRAPAERPSEPVAPASTRSPADFAQRFDDAFARLDRAKGCHNFVHLLDLRKALLLDRGDFDAGLTDLRAAGRYVLSAAEGRHELTPEERAAGIHEDGALLLYVSRRDAL
jgi:hypothetical protein